MLESLLATPKLTLPHRCPSGHQGLALGSLHHALDPPLHPGVAQQHPSSGFPWEQRGSPHSANPSSTTEPGVFSACHPVSPRASLEMLCRRDGVAVGQGGQIRPSCDPTASPSILCPSRELSGFPHPTTTSIHPSPLIPHCLVAKQLGRSR